MKDFYQDSNLKWVSISLTSIPTDVNQENASMVTNHGYIISEDWSLSCQSSGGRITLFSHHLFVSMGFFNSNVHDLAYFQMTLQQGLTKPPGTQPQTDQKNNNK